MDESRIEGGAVGHDQSGGESTQEDKGRAEAGRGAKRAKTESQKGNEGLVIDDLVSFGDEPDLFDKVLSYLTKILPTLPEKKALEIEQELRALHGGDTHYIRKHISYNALSAFNGRNASEIARIIGVSRSTVYRKLKQPKKNATKS